MGIARTSALQIRLDRGLGARPPTWDELLSIAIDAGASVELDQPFVGLVREVYSAGSIGLQEGLTPCWRRWCLTHAIGHHLLHPSGNHLFLETSNQRYHVDRNEMQAEIFSGYMLFGALTDPPAGVRDVQGIAEWAEVPLTCALRWTRLVEYLSAVPIVLDRYDISLRFEDRAGLT